MTLPEVPRAFHIMAKPTGADCNLNCDYCFFLKKGKLYPESNFRMSDEVHEAYIRLLFNAQCSRSTNWSSTYSVPSTQKTPVILWTSIVFSGMSSVPITSSSFPSWSASIRTGRPDFRKEMR
jgi:hypothetical protein